MLICAAGPGTPSFLTVIAAPARRARGIGVLGTVMTMARGALTAMLLMHVGLACAFATQGPAASRGLAAVARPHIAPRPVPARRASASMLLPPDDGHAFSSLMQLAADVSEDFDINSLPGLVQGALGSPLVLAIPIGLGITIGAVIIAFLIFSMGGM